MEIDAQHLIEVIREQRNQALDQLAMTQAALKQTEAGADDDSTELS